MSPICLVLNLWGGIETVTFNTQWEVCRSGKLGWEVTEAHCTRDNKTNYSYVLTEPDVGYVSSCPQTWKEAKVIPIPKNLIIKSYLFCRSQRVLHTTMGLSQTPNIFTVEFHKLPGPLLFTIFTNHRPILAVYSDDITLYTVCQLVMFKICL